jgi:hypothetical protein
MQLVLVAHILCGLAGLLAGYVALYAAKGAPSHRRSGVVFVSVMLTLAVTGLMISAVQGVAPALNIPTAALTFYLVVTGFTTVQPPAGAKRWIDHGAAAMAFATALMFLFAAGSYLAESGAASFPAFMLLLFGVVSAGAGVGDVRQLRRGRLTGVARLKRHLWRMCFALFIASIAIFASTKRLPVALRIPVLQFAGAVLPLAAIAYWQWRLRVRRAAHVVSRFVISEAAS